MTVEKTRVAHHSVSVQSREGSPSYLYPTDIECSCGRVLHGPGIPSAQEAFNVHVIMENPYVKAAWERLRAASMVEPGLAEDSPSYAALVNYIRIAIREAI